MTTLEAIIIAIVEGLTEFLPISSTGHMIVTERLLGVESTDFTKLFTVGIQLGAILAVVGVLVIILLIVAAVVVMRRRK